MSLEFRKELICEEDLLTGFDQVVQSRGTVSPINCSSIPYDLTTSLLTELDSKLSTLTASTTYALIGGDEAQVFLADAPTVDGHVVNLGYFNTGMALKADKDNVLELDNVDAFFPSANYHPCTKQYADNINSAILGNVITKDDQRIFTPTGDYNPSTKKYVDDKFSSGASGSFTSADGKTITVSNGLITGIV